MSALRYLVVGSFNLDTVIRLRSFPPPHSKVQAEEIWRGPGGSAAITAAWLARQGSAVSLVAASGGDHEAHEAIGRLTATGVNCRFVTTTSPESSRAYSLVTETEKRIITRPSGQRLPALKSAEEVLHEFDAVHIASAASPELMAFATTCRERRIPFSVELAGRRMPEITCMAERTFLNSDELSLLFPSGWSDFRTDVGGTLVARNGRLVVTRGRIGASEHGEDLTVTAPTVAVTSVDRTGGGDAFNAGYLYEWQTGGTPEECLQAGLRLATSAITRMGGLP
ncbi:MAG: hypothetical protein EOL89_00110 [Actinobacteria bacterium]|nr:hypothetical protein [Actinomycetota bacterium]